MHQPSEKAVERTWENLGHLYLWSKYYCLEYTSNLETLNTPNQTILGNMGYGVKK